MSKNKQTIEKKIFSAFFIKLLYKCSKIHMYQRDGQSIKKPEFLLTG